MSIELKTELFRLQIFAINLSTKSRYDLIWIKLNKALEFVMFEQLNDIENLTKNSFKSQFQFETRKCCSKMFVCIECIKNINCILFQLQLNPAVIPSEMHLKWKKWECEIDIPNPICHEPLFWNNRKGRIWD